MSSNGIPLAANTDRYNNSTGKSSNVDSPQTMSSSGIPLAANTDRVLGVGTVILLVKIRLPATLPAMVAAALPAIAATVGFVWSLAVRYSAVQQNPLLPRNTSGQTALPGWAQSSGVGTLRMSSTCRDTQ